MRSRPVASAVLLMLAINAGAQEEWFHYLNGPFHRPTVAVDEFGNLLSPMLVYHDKDEEVYIPDFTGTDESRTRPAAFKHNGQYEFVIYTYYIASHKTNRSFVTGNAESGEIHLHKMDALGVC